MMITEKSETQTGCHTSEDTQLGWQTESEVQHDSETHTLPTTQYSSVLLECVFLLSLTVAGICRNPPTSSFWSFTKI